MGIFWAKNLRELVSFSNPLGVIAIILFGLGIVILLFMLVRAWKTIKLQKIIKSIIYNVHIVNSAPSRFLLRNCIKSLSTKPQFEKKVKVWNYWVFRTFTIIYNNLVNDFCELLNSDSPFSLKKTNINDFLEIDEKFKNLKLEINIINQQMYDFATEELLLRNYIIYLKENFDNLKDECLNFAISQKGIKIRKMEYAIKKTQERFDAYYNLLKTAKYSEIYTSLTEISEFMNYIMDLLDKMPNLLSVLNKVLPDKLQRLRKDYLVIGDKANVQFAYERLSELSYYVQEKSLLIMQMLSKLQFITAEEHLVEIFKEIKHVENVINKGDLLRNYFTNNMPIIKAATNRLGFAKTGLREAYEQLELYKINNLEDQNQVMTLIKKCEKTEQLAQKVYEIYTNDASLISGSELNKLKDICLKLFEEMQSNAAEVNKLFISINKKLNDHNFLVNDVIFMQSLLTQYTSKIRNSERLLAKLQPIIQNFTTINQKLEKYDSDYFEKILQNSNEYHDAELEVNTIKEEIFKFMVTIDDQIFIDSLCQKVILNLEEQPSSKKAIQKNVETLERMYDQQEYEALLTTWENIMSQKEINEQQTL